MKIVLFLVLLTVGGSGSSRVAARPGQSVTLSCRYDIRSHGALSVCWGRGEIPTSGCSQQLVSTDGLSVKEGTRVSSRYQLLGRLDEGEVSLTILNVTGSDAGRYGCRVAVFGLFNDVKHHFDLVVEKAAQTTSCSPSDRDTAEPTARHTGGHFTARYEGQVTSTERLHTSSSSSIEAEQSSSLTGPLVCVVFGLLALVAAGGLVIIAKRWWQLNKMPQQVDTQLHSRGSVVENIYQMDGGSDGGEYEFCPET